MTGLVRWLQVFRTAAMVKSMWYTCGITALPGKTRTSEYRTTKHHLSGNATYVVLCMLCPASSQDNRPTDEDRGCHTDTVRTFRLAWSPGRPAYDTTTRNASQTRLNATVSTRPLSRTSPSPVRLAHALGRYKLGGGHACVASIVQPRPAFLRIQMM